MTTNTNKLLFMLTRDDWYKCQEENRKDDYLEFSVRFNEDTKSFSASSSTLYGGVSSSGYTAEEIEGWFFRLLELHSFKLSDFEFSECYGLKEHPELKELFTKIIPGN